MAKIVQKNIQKPAVEKTLKIHTQRQSPSSVKVMVEGEYHMGWGPFAGGEIVVTHADGSAERFESEAEYAAKYEEI